MGTVARRTYEKHSLLEDLQTYMTSKGWTGLTYESAWKDITNPQVVVRFLPTTSRALQLGGGPDKVFERIVQIDAYMENESRAEAISDDLMDFFIDAMVEIITPENALVGWLQCNDEDSIFGEVLPPATATVRLERWRGIARATLEAHYPNG